MRDREYQIARVENHRKEESDVNSIGPCNLLQEVHNDRMEMRVRSVKNDRTVELSRDRHDQIRVIGAIPVYDRKEQTTMVDHAYNKRIKTADDREIIEQHHDRERNYRRKDKVLFGLISSDRKERNITHDIAVDGSVSRFNENSREHKVKFLGITIAHSRHIDNNDPSVKELRCKQKIQAPRIHRGGRSGW